MIRHVAIVVPVANEAEHLGLCLTHLDAARAHLRELDARVEVRVVVVLDDCHDASEQIALRFDAEIVRVTARCVGAARRAGTRAALVGHNAPEQTWLANTDADSLVPRNWLTDMLASANRGTHVVLGTVTPGPGLLPHIHFAWHTNHALEEGHAHVHGANFGIRGDTYLRLGGWPELSNGEDVALAARAEAATDVNIARAASIPVITSTRLQARVPFGFSGYLRDLSTRNERRAVG